MRLLIGALVLFLLTPSLVVADPPPTPTQDALARAIFRAKTGPEGNMRWRECNRNIIGAEAAERAREYAGYLMEEYRADNQFDPWIAAAIMAQESSFNRCAISRGAWRIIDETFSARYGRRPVEDDIRRILRSRRLRERLGVGVLDAGLAQFRWPGVVARQAGLRDPGDLINARRNIGLLARSLVVYRAQCATVPRFGGISRRGRRYNVACMDGYWVHHNTGGSWFNLRYYRNVNRWYERLTGEYATSTTIEAYDDAGR